MGSGPCGHTDMTENITSAQTMYVVDNNEIYLFELSLSCKTISMNCSTCELTIRPKQKKAVILHVAKKVLEG